MVLLTLGHGHEAGAKVLFLAHFDGDSADADFAAGSPTARPVPDRGFEVAATTPKGRFGSGLDITDPNRNCIYEALGNIDLVQGTIDFWYRIETLEGAAYNPFVGWYHNRTSPDGTKLKNAFEIYRYGNGVVLGVYGPYEQNTSNIDPQTGSWHHMAINWDCRGGDGASVYNLYIDGKHIVRLADALALKHPGGFLHLGMWDYGFGMNLRGQMDELRITDQVEHLTNFTPPTAPYPTPGTAAALLAALSAAETAREHLTESSSTLRAVAPKSEEATRLLSRNEALLTRGAQTIRAIRANLNTEVASKTGQSPPPAGPTPAQIDGLALDLMGFQDRADTLVAGIHTAHRETVASVGRQFQQIPAHHNDAVVDLAFLRDELEGLGRGLFYATGLADTASWQAELDRGLAYVRDAGAALQAAADAFHGIYADAPGAGHDPVPAIPALSADRGKREVLAGVLSALKQIQDEIGRHRQSTRLALQAVRAAMLQENRFPDYAPFDPTPLPPLKVSPDGTLSRLVFGGSFGRAETMMALDFDTLSEEAPSVTWEAPDRFETKLNPASEYQWDNYQIPLSNTVLLYAVGDSMYRPAWFADEYDDNPEYYFVPSKSYVGSTGFDYRHPVPRRLIQEYLEAAARIHATKPYTFIYKGPWEAHPYRGFSVDVPGHRTTAFQEHGFSDIAVEAFRRYLEDKYGAIDALNRAWRSSYEDFASIEPPDPLISAFIITKDERNQDVYTIFYPNKRLPGAPTTGLTYEFERCRKDLYADYLEDCYRAIRRGDPMRPLASSTSGSIMGEILINSLDDLQMAERCVDMWGKHPSGGYGWPDSPYMYGLNRYFNKTLVALEYYGWAQEEIGDDFWPTFVLAPGALSQRVYDAGRRDTWHEYSWDRRMLLFYWTQKTVQLPKGFRPSTAPLVRSWSGLFPVTKRRTMRLNDIFMHVPIVAPTIGVVHPGVSIINGYPYNSCMKTTRDIFDRLLSRQYHFGVVPEKFIVNGRDTLDNYDVIILPSAQYFEDGFGELLLAWVERGGTLITAGPFGLYSKYGHAIEAGAAEIFPDIRFSYPTPQGREVSWQWEARKNGELIEDTYLAADHGRGRILVAIDGRGFQRAGQVAAEPHVGIEIGAEITGESAEETTATRKNDRVRPGTVESPEDFTPPVRAFYDALEAGTRRKAWVTEGNIEMVLRRSSPDDPLFMSLLNWNFGAPQTTEVTVEGEYRDVVDLSIEGGFPVPVTVVDGRTTFRITFGAGEGLMLRLDRSN